MSPFATKIYTIEHPQAIQIALNALLAGELIAFPTDTVYGLGTLVRNTEGIEEIYKVKIRERQKGIPVLIGKIEDLDMVVALNNEAATKLIETFWPGPLTIIFQRNTKIPMNLAPLPTVGVRMPNHPIALDLLKSSGPLAVTSANLSGKQSTRTAEEVYAQLAGRISLILDGGKTPGGIPSTVVDCTKPSPRILRVGPISKDEIERALAVP